MWTRPYDPYIIAKTGGKYKHFARFLQKSAVERNVDRRCISFGKMWRCGEKKQENSDEEKTEENGAWFSTKFCTLWKK